ncbi:MAG: lysozyme [Bacteroidetes bacterium]|nr:lysozyme [Bacteroidota bacterium]MBS1981702.1 lysozyme [Bacteroidota bacterium]
MPKLQLFIIHCTATPEGRNVTAGEIHQWHQGPLVNADGSVVYKSKIYKSIGELPNETIGGVPISKLRGRGWRQVGYSDMIMLDGTLVNLTPYNEDDEVEPWEITNGQPGTNSIARHIVYVGGLDKSGKNPKDTRTPAQLKTMEAWIHNIITYHPEIKGAGHNQFYPKDCPSFFVPQWLKSIGVGDKNIFVK